MFEEALMALGKLSWQALQKDVQQLLLSEVRKHNICLILLVIQD